MQYFGTGGSLTTFLTPPPDITQRFVAGAYSTTRRIRKTPTKNALDRHLHSSREQEFHGMRKMRRGRVVWLLALVPATLGAGAYVLSSTSESDTALAPETATITRAQPKDALVSNESATIAQGEAAPSGAAAAAEVSEPLGGVFSERDTSSDRSLASAVSASADAAEGAASANASASVSAVTAQPSSGDGASAVRLASLGSGFSVGGGGGGRSTARNSAGGEPAASPSNAPQGSNQGGDSVANQNSSATGEEGGSPPDPAPGPDANDVPQDRHDALPQQSSTPAAPVSVPEPGSLGLLLVGLLGWATARRRASHRDISATHCR
jgi:hypothetical protein